VLGRQKEIQYASRVKSCIVRQEQIHRLRHIIRRLAAQLPAERRNDPEISDIEAYGCHTTMHLVRFLVPRLDGEDHTKDIDFTPTGIRARWRAGHADALRVLAERPWEREIDPLEGVAVHEVSHV
jgi:NTE family protein